MLFGHLRVRRFVVIELKAGPFKSEYAGKMNFYLNLVNDQLRHADDTPRIDRILCREARRLVAEYALRDIEKPMAVAEWRVRLTRELPEKVESRLPSIEAIKQEMGDSDV